MPKHIPAYHEFFNPVLEALRRLGGSATIAELLEAVIALMKLPDALTEIPHGDGSQTEIGYRIAWARTYLKKYGVLENSQRGVWSLTERGRQVQTVDPTEVQRHVRELYQREQPMTGTSPERDERPSALDDDDGGWEFEALTALKAMDSTAFERLCQRLLRESGFIEVEVTGRSGDGGIDGRDGATPIDLIDGTLLVQKLKELGLGIRTHMVETVEVDPAWFAAI